MVDILVKPTTLRNTASQVREHSRHLQQALEVVDKIIHELESVQFEGNRADSLRLRYRPLLRFPQAMGALFLPSLPRQANRSLPIKLESIK